MPGKQKKCRLAGYTLLELIVVMVIVGILATQVMFMLSSDTNKVKGAAFNMRNDFNYARAEAVNRNKTVLVDFVFDSGGRDGYSLCVDDSGDGSCGAGDDSIKDVLFDSRVQFYDPITLPDHGPNQTPGGTNIIGLDGVIFAGNSFSMQPDGTIVGASGGTVIIYVHESGNPSVIKGEPYAVVVGSTTGRVRLMRWDKASGTWGTK